MKSPLIRLTKLSAKEKDYFYEHYNSLDLLGNGTVLMVNPIEEPLDIALGGVSARSGRKNSFDKSSNGVLERTYRQVCNEIHIPVVATGIYRTDDRGFLFTEIREGENHMYINTGLLQDALKWCIEKNKRNSLDIYMTFVPALAVVCVSVSPLHNRRLTSGPIVIIATSQV